MFTGLIQQVGTVVSLERNVLLVSATRPDDDPWVLGESVSVNGCCLTVVSFDGPLRFDLSDETLARTNLSDLRPNHPVNLERAMKVGDRFGGHIVQGHVDTVGTVIKIHNESFHFEVPSDGAKYLIDKGSITIDGISLTVVEPIQSRFHVAVIPHTLENTNLRSLQLRDRVNIEYDVIAKHVENLLAYK